MLSPANTKRWKNFEIRAFPRHWISIYRYTLAWPRGNLGQITNSAPVFLALIGDQHSQAPGITRFSWGKVHQVSFLCLTLPEHNSCPVRATFESLGTGKLESDNENSIMRRQLTKDNVKDFCIVQNKLQHPLIPIHVSHTPFSQWHLNKSSKPSCLLQRETWEDPLEQIFAVSREHSRELHHIEKEVRRLLYSQSPENHSSTEGNPQYKVLKFRVFWWRIHSPERLLDSPDPQIDDLEQIITGTGQQLCSLRVQVQSCDSSKQLQFFYNAFSPKDRKKGKKEKQKGKEKRRQWTRVQKPNQCIKTLTCPSVEDKKKNYWVFLTFCFFPKLDSTWWIAFPANS